MTVTNCGDFTDSVTAWVLLVNQVLCHKFANGKEQIVPICQIKDTLSVIIKLMSKISNTPCWYSDFY